jgi:RND family efflux transporter MFP subunit
MSTEQPDLSRLRIDAALPPLLEHPLRKWRIWIGVGVCLVIGLLYLILKPAPPPSVEERAVVDTAMSKAPVLVNATTLSASGYVVAQRQAAVSSKATGRLKELHIVEGDLVKEGQILGVLENDDLKALVKEVEANVAVLQARLNWALAESENVGLEFGRAQKLSKQAVISAAEFDLSNARYKKSVAELETARSNVTLAEAQLEKAKVDLSYTYIVAPFDGTVLTKDADVGEIVAPFGASANARAAIVTIANMESLQVEADVSEANITKVHVGQRCTITLDSFPEREYLGEVVKIVPTVDRAKATILTKIKFLERDEKVIPEMSAKIKFLLG